VSRSRLAVRNHVNALGCALEQVQRVDYKVHGQSRDHLAEHGQAADDEQRLLAKDLELGGYEAANALQGATG
jgi:hypothetical protein